MKKSQARTGAFKTTESVTTNGAILGNVGSHVKAVVQKISAGVIECFLCCLGFFLALLRRSFRSHFVDKKPSSAVLVVGAPLESVGLF